MLRFCFGALSTVRISAQMVDGTDRQTSSNRPIYMLRKVCVCVC